MGNFFGTIFFLQIVQLKWDGGSTKLDKSIKHKLCYRGRKKATQLHYNWKPKPRKRKHIVLWV